MTMSLRDLLRQLARIAKVLHALADELEDLVAGHLPSAGPLDPNAASPTPAPPKEHDRETES